MPRLSIRIAVATDLVFLFFLMLLKPKFQNKIKNNCQTKEEHMIDKILFYLVEKDTENIKVQNLSKIKNARFGRFNFHF